MEHQKRIYDRGRLRRPSDIIGTGACLPGGCSLSWRNVVYTEEKLSSIERADR